MCRLDVLLQAEVVCATLSGSGSQALVEAVMLSAQNQAYASAKATGRLGRKLGRGTRVDVGAGTVLSFDAVVMVSAAGTWRGIFGFAVCA